MKLLILSIFFLSGCAAFGVAIEQENGSFMYTDGIECYKIFCWQEWVKYSTFEQQELICEEEKIGCTEEIINQFEELK